MTISNHNVNTEGLKPRMTATSGNESGNATASEPESPAIERSDSGESRASEGNKSLPARRATGPRTPRGKQRSSLNALKHGIFSASILLKGESLAEYNSLLEGLIKAKAPVGKLEEVHVEILATTLWRKRHVLQAERAEIQKGIDLMNWEQQIRKSEEAHRHDCSLLMENISLMENTSILFLKIDNPFALKRCLDLLAQLRDQITENGFTDSDLEILKQLYGDADQSNLGANLHNEYMNWSDTSRVSEAERMKQGCATPEECKHSVLVAINREIRRLKEYQKIEVERRAVPESPALDRLLRYEASLDRLFDRTLAQLERLQRMRLGQPVSPRIDVNIAPS